VAHKLTGFLSVLIFILFAISCNSNSTTQATPTQTSVPSISSTPTEIPTIESTLPPSPLPADTPTAIPISINLYLPNGVTTYSSGSSKVSYYDLRGQLLGELQSVTLGMGSLQQAVIAGPLTNSAGPILPPMVYLTFENGGELWQNDNINVTLLRAAPNLLNMISAPGKDIFVFTLLEYLDYGLGSNLYVGDLQTITTVDPILQSISTESTAVRPLAISINDGQPAGIWYTSVPYGIGGDIVFEPRTSLSYLNLSDYQTQTHLDMTKDPIGISDDQSWVAFTSANGIGPVSITQNFDFSTGVTIPLRPDSDRGAGEAVFSPDNQYLAWKEASGSIAAQPSTFHETVRIASVDGKVITEIPDTSLLSVSGYSEISWLVPIGWLDPQTLALEVQGSSIENVSILTVKFDGSGVAFLVPGSFIGFLYP
jgi:hypothetical protein